MKVFLLQCMMGAIIVQNLSMTPSMHSGMNKLYRQIVSLFCILTICFYFSCFIVTLVACFVMVRDYLYILLIVNTAEFHMLILDVCVCQNAVVENFLCKLYF